MLSAFLKVSQRLTRLYNVTQINILHNLNFYNYRCWGKQGCFNTSHLPAQPSYMDVNGSGQGTGCSFLQSLFFTGRKNGQWFLKYTHAMFVGSNIKGTFNFEPFFCITPRNSGISPFSRSQTDTNLTPVWIVTAKSRNALCHGFQA